MAENQITNIDKKDFELKLQTHPTRQLFIKIEVMDTNDKVIAEVSGSAVDGNYNIDNSSPLRRTCSITFNLENGYLPSETSVFWINKRFKLYVGLKYIENDNIYWFNKGTYAIKDPTINISISENTITINGLDKMALHNGEVGGQLEYAFITEVQDEEGSPIEVNVEDAVEALMRDGGETNLLISKTNLILPYKIESAIGDTRYDVLSKFTELFYNYQAYYNLDGYFIFGTKPMYQSANSVVNDIAMDFSEEYSNDLLITKPYNLIISINREIAYSNVKNKIVVYGGVHEDGFQPSYTIIVDEAHYPTSPYTIEKLDERASDGTPIYRTLVVQDEVYVDDGKAQTEGDSMESVHAYSINLCKARAEEEVYLHQQSTDKVTITCLPIYSLDVNEVIFLNDSVSGAYGEYVINNISCGLGAGDTMTINANKLW